MGRSPARLLLAAGLPQPPNGDGAQGAERAQVPGGVLPREGDPALPLHVPDRPVLPRGRVGLHREDRRPLRGFGRCPQATPPGPSRRTPRPSRAVSQASLLLSLLPVSTPAGSEGGSARVGRPKPGRARRRAACPCRRLPAGVCSLLAPRRLAAVGSHLAHSQVSRGALTQGRALPRRTPRGVRAGPMGRAPGDLPVPSAPCKLALSLGSAPHLWKERIVGF